MLPCFLVNMLSHAVTCFDERDGHDQRKSVRLSQELITISHISEIFQSLLITSSPEEVIEQGKTRIELMFRLLVYVCLRLIKSELCLR